MHGVEKIANTTLYLQTVRDSPIDTMERNRKLYVADRSVSVPMTLSDVERQDPKGQTFPDDLSNYAQTISPTAIEFGMVTHVAIFWAPDPSLRLGVFERVCVYTCGKPCLYGVRHSPNLREGSSASSK